MRHFIVFCYIFTILIGVSALTIQWLAGKGKKGKEFAAMRPFIVMLLAMNVYDFIIYYSDKIINYPSGNLLLSFGDCLIAALVIVWLHVAAEIDLTGPRDTITKAAVGFGVFYAVVWLAAVLFFREQFWVRLVIDVPLILLLAAGSLYYIGKGYHKAAAKSWNVYRIVITLFMAVNYMTYFISETGIRHESNEQMLDMTIFFWLVINAANCVLLYRRDFVQSYLDTPAVVPENSVSAEPAWEQIRETYALTRRELEILQEIYSGRSNTQIAETLFISESTVKAHVYHLFRKMKVKSRVEAVCLVRDEK